MLPAPMLHAAMFDITSFGAKGDGKTQNREAINKAIDAAAAAGGGTADFPAGTWITGSIRLRSNPSHRSRRRDRGQFRNILIRSARTEPMG